MEILSELQRLGDQPTPYHVNLADIEDAALHAERLGRANQGGYSRGDPYARKYRKSQRARRYIERGTGIPCQPRSQRSNLKAMHKVITDRRVEAQQEIEAWLRKRGVSWRNAAMVIHRDYRGDWNKIELAMVRWGHEKKGVSNAA